MKIHRYLGSLTLLIILLVAALVLTSFHQPVVLAQQTNAALTLQPEPTPASVWQAADEIGSTDGILLMGIVIVLIVTLPLLFHKQGK
jgi:predicted ferric reductase